MSDEEAFFYKMDGEGNIVKYDAKTGTEIQSQRVPAKSPWVFNEAIAEVICNKIAKGLTLSKVSNMQGFPNMGVIVRWRAEHPEFDDALKLAQEARAVRLHDRMIDSLEDTRNLDKDEIAAEKLYFEKLKYLAKADDRKRYGERDAKSEQGSGNVTIHLNTGIKRDAVQVPDKVFEVIQQKKNKEQE